MKIMTFKTKLASLFSLMLISLITVQAQDAKALLDEVSTKVKSYDNIQLCQKCSWPFFYMNKFDILDRIHI